MLSWGWIWILSLDFAQLVIVRYFEHGTTRASPILLEGDLPGSRLGQRSKEFSVGIVINLCINKSDNVKLRGCLYMLVVLCCK